MYPNMTVTLNAHIVNRRRRVALRELAATEDGRHWQPQVQADCCPCHHPGQI
jgi:hypothetical protein